MISLCQNISRAPRFQWFIIGVIVLAAILIGLETSEPTMARYGTIIHFLDRVVLWIFVVEALIKILAHFPRPWKYFQDGWNLFDFAIVAVCFLPIHAEYIAVLRLARLLRVLRLITVLPRLQMLVGALLHSIPSMGYVGLMLLLHFYMFAVMGVFFFGKIDPASFGNLASAMLTLFQIVTLEGWIDVMQVQRAAHPILAPAYFILFILLGTMIMLNLFIGVIMNSMQEMQEEMEQAHRKEMHRDGLNREEQIEELIFQLEEIKTKLKNLQK
ncbi:MAG: ion transporter [Verrucomicrobiae bacterium]|nr:ion transporter [Verrucomicrobiae bacterium]